MRVERKKTVTGSDRMGGNGGLGRAMFYLALKQAKKGIRWNDCLE